LLHLPADELACSASASPATWSRPGPSRPAPVRWPAPSWRPSC
jgi:hypothetical protein